MQSAWDGKSSCLQIGIEGFQSIAITCEEGNRAREVLHSWLEIQHKIVPREGATEEKKQTRVRVKPISRQSMQIPTSHPQNHGR